MADIANVPETGCGTPDGDCEPAARLHALRALSDSAGEDVGPWVMEHARISPAGEWSVAP